MISPSGQRCACPCRNAFDCWRRRYPRSPDDDDDSGSIRMEGGPCECGCHEEFRCDDPEEDWL